MASAPRTIAIHSSTPPVGCGACVHDGGATPACLAGDDGPPAGAPEFSGPADEVARLMAALARRLGFEPEAVGLVRALHVQPGEVELRLAVHRHCGGAELADTAFQTLRGLLPDTDIYVTHAA